jgi:hypothetical protein
MKKAAFLLSLFFISVIASAQGVDFSGSWKINSSKSKLNEQFSMAPKAIIIVQKANELNIERHSEFQGQEFTSNDTLTLDGQECINPGFMDTQKKSTAVWADDKSSLKIANKISMGDGNDMTIVEVYKLDGDNLVIQSEASSSFGDLSETMVYDKQ